MLADTAVSGVCVFDDPVLAISRTISKMLQDAGFREIGLGPDLISPEDDGDYRLDIEDALSPDGLLPFVVRRAERSYNIDGHAPASGAFPLSIQKDEDALLGERVVWRVDETGLAHLDDAIACISNALKQMMAESPDSWETLTFGAGEARIPSPERSPQQPSLAELVVLVDTTTESHAPA